MKMFIAFVLVGAGGRARKLKCALGQRLWGEAFAESYLHRGYLAKGLY